MSTLNSQKTRDRKAGEVQPKDVLTLLASGVTAPLKQRTGLDFLTVKNALITVAPSGARGVAFSFEEHDVIFAIADSDVVLPMVRRTYRDVATVDSVNETGNPPAVLTFTRPAGAVGLTVQLQWEAPNPSGEGTVQMVSPGVKFPFRRVRNVLETIFIPDE